MDLEEGVLGGAAASANPLAPSVDLSGGRPDKPAAGGRRRQRRTRATSGTASASGLVADAVAEDVSRAAQWVAGRRNQPFTLGEVFAMVVLVAPTFWAICMVYWAENNETAVVDSAGNQHTIDRSENWNFASTYYCGELMGISTVFAHMWVTLASIARRHHLNHMGDKARGRLAYTYGGDDPYRQYGGDDSVPYANRLVAAQAEATSLSRTEIVHVALVVLETMGTQHAAFTCAFGTSRTDNGKCELNPQGWLMLLCPITFVCFTAFSLTRARGAILEAQCLNCLEFASDALRSTLKALLIQMAIFLRFAGFASTHPVDIFRGDCDLTGQPTSWEPNTDSKTVGKWLKSTPIYNCPHLLGVGVTKEQAAAVKENHETLVFNTHVPLAYEFHSSIAFIGYIGLGTALYLAARGQGLLHDRLFKELDLKLEHVFTFLFWLLATIGIMLAAAVMGAHSNSDDVLLNNTWLGTDEKTAFIRIEWAIYGCTYVGLVGLTASIWSKDIIRATITRGSQGTTHDVFISYQSEASTDVFLSLHLALNSMGEGLNVFNQMRDLAKADVNKEIMQEHARNSKVVLALLSPNYFDSKWCRYELIAAQEAGVPIVPVFSGYKDSYPALLQLNDELREDAEKGPAVKAAFAQNLVDVHNPEHAESVTRHLREITERFCR